MKLDFFVVNRRSAIRTADGETGSQAERNATVHFPSRTLPVSSVGPSGLLHAASRVRQCATV